MLMRNDGTGRFVDVADKSGSYFRNKYVGRGATYGDYDNDGDLDLLVINLNDSPRLLRNDGGNKNNWLTVQARPWQRVHGCGYYEQSRSSGKSGPDDAYGE